MQSWPVQDAKARFSEFLDTCLSDGPQVVSRRGTETAVLVSLSEWKRLQSVAKPSLKSLLLSPVGRTDDLYIPKRGNARRRVVQEII
ncbi:MAG: prevent-host-death protein [Proteobacteria bacterium]|nr:MAG: prevent-host-death protein [Pseudomonadota bacterium]